MEKTFGECEKSLAILAEMDRSQLALFGVKLMKKFAGFRIPDASHTIPTASDEMFVIATKLGEGDAFLVTSEDVKFFAADDIPEPGSLIRV